MGETSIIKSRHIDLPSSDDSHMAGDRKEANCNRNDDDAMMGTITTTAAPSSTTVILGRCVSGRSWKDRNQKPSKHIIQSASSMVKKRAGAKDWQDRMQERQHRKGIAELQRTMQDEKRQAALDKKQRRLEQEQRRAQNEFQQQQQSANALNLNTARLKLRAMSKKQLRHIKKTRVNPKTGITEYVPAYSKT